ncbi:MAG: beta strand repeat-containing protein [Lentimicrobium sp.]
MGLNTVLKYISSLFRHTLYLAPILVMALGVNAQPVSVSNSNGTDGNYSTLADAFNAINSTSQAGTTITVTISGNTTEPASGAMLNAGSWISLTIYPTGSYSVTGDVTTALLHLNGADRVTIDGRINQTGDPALQLINNNTGTAASTLQFSNSAQNNVISFCNLSGGSTNTGGGIVYFAGSSTSPGNDENTISNNFISGISSSLRPVNALYSQATTAIDNSGNLITNNNIFNFLNPALASSGIHLSSGSASWTISGNSFYETSSLSPSANVEYAVIRINNTNGNGFVLENNDIGGNSPSGNGMWIKTGSADNLFYGIYLRAGNTPNSNSVQGNHLQHIDWTNSLNANWTGIHVETGLVNIGTTSGNTIGSGEGIDNIRITFGTSSTTANPSGVFGINYASSLAGTIQNNTIGAITTNNSNPAFSCNFYGIAKIANFTSTPLIISNNIIGSLLQNPSISAGSPSLDSVQVVHGIYYNIRNINLGFVTISNNTISGLANLTNNLSLNSAAPGGQVHGIHVYLFSNTIAGNTISNLTTSARNINSGQNASIIGIMSRFSGTNQQISGNTMVNFANSSSARARVMGIYYHGSQNVNNRISENFICNLSVSSVTSGAPFGEIYGIRINYGAGTYSNNIISLGANVSASVYIYGILDPGTLGNNLNLYHNSIYINGVSNQTGCNSYAFFSSNNLNLKNIRNNIFHNGRTNTAGSTYHCSVHFQLNSNGVLSNDYNNYYISPTGFTARVGPPTPLVVIATLPDWQTFFGQDAHSNNDNSNFVNGSGLFNLYTDFIPGNPHNGVTGTGITTDFNGTARNCAHTLGAFELALPVETPSGITVFSGTEPTCQTAGTEITTYSTSAENSTGFNWSLSNELAGIINPETGEMTWATDFSGSVNIQVTAEGCNGTSAMVTRTVGITPAVGTPADITIFSGTEPSCQTAGTEITSYSTSAENSTGFNWSLSNELAGNINPETGEMAWAADFSGSVDIQVTANGCNGTSAMVTRTVSITPAVGTPADITIFSGTEPSCQTAGTEITTYSTSATNSTGYHWSLSNELAGIINPETGEMAWAADFSGPVDIQVTADGCNGTSAMVTRTVNITPAVGTPADITIFSGTEPSCQTAGTEITTYSTSATNSTGYHWSLSNELAGIINPETGEMAWAAGFSGPVDIQVTADGCNGTSAMVTRTVGITPAVGTPSDIVLLSGTEPTCQTAGTEITTYSTAAANSTGFNWSLSNELAGIINPETGEMTWAAGFSGPVDIQVTANGCNGTSAMVTRTVGITPAVGTPSAIAVFSGTEPTCQTAGTEITTYSTAAANSTGFNWSLSNELAGIINPETGEMAWAAGFSGSVDIQVTANGCNGTSAMVTRTVGITPAVGTPSDIVLLSGSEPSCQTAGTEITTYSTSATNSTGYHWSISNELAGNINPETGEMTWAADFSGPVDIQVTADGCNGTSAMVTRTVGITPAVGTPSDITVFAGTEPTCQTTGTEITSYSTSAENSTGFNWSLSNELAGIINPETGEMAWAAGFSGPVDIQVTANGCNGTSAMVTRTVGITPAVGTPSDIVLLSGTEPTCQTAGTEITTYSTAAANSTGFNWSLSNELAGNINPDNGEMTWATDFSGPVDIQVTADGCNGTSALVTRTVGITPAVGTPSDIVLLSGTEPTCQTAGTEITTYSTAAANSTGFNWSLSNELAGMINPETGEMAWAAGFSGPVDIQVTANGCNGTSAMVTRTVHITPAVGTPSEIAVFSGTEPSCQTTGTEITTYSTSAENSTGFNWSLSNELAGNINPENGEMTWAAGFSGPVDIQVTADGCSGTSAMVTRTVSITPAVGTPADINIFSGTEPTCQTAGTEITSYSTAAANNTGFNWSLSNELAGIINPETGEMTWAAGFSGSVDIQVTAGGCNGTSAMITRTVGITPAVGTPSDIVLLSGSEPTCQTAGTEITTYSTSAANSTGYHWSLSNELAGNINPETGEMTWAADFSGPVDIQVTANGCNGTSVMVTRTVGITPAVGIPAGITILSGTEPTCQTAGTEITSYSTAATNSTGYHWSLSNELAGIINPETGEMAWAAGFSGNVDIQVTADGCNGTSAIVTRTVGITPAVGTPADITIFSGTEPSCQTAGTEITTYSTSAANSTGYHWSLSNELAGNINPENGEMTYAAGFSGPVDIQVTADGCSGTSAMVTRTVSITPAVGTPADINIFSGTEPTCQTAGTEITTYSTSAANSTGYHWSLSNELAGNINPENGEMTWAAGFSGPVDIQVTADGCNGTSAMVTRTIGITPAVGIPAGITIFSGTEPTCQTAGTEITTYSTIAANSTGYHWSLSNELAGIINPETGEMAWAADFSGSVDIQVTANGCNGTSAMVTRTVGITPAVGTPSDIVLLSGSEPTCQTAGTEITTYSTSATNSTGYHWSLSNELAGNINPETGEMTWAAGFSGPVDIQVTANGCNGTSAMVVRQVIINPNPEPVILSDANNVCAGTTGHIYTTEALMTGYTWALSSGGTIASGEGTNVLTAAWNTPGEQIVSVSYTDANGCTTILPAIFPVTVNPILAAGITIEASANPANEGSPVTFTATPENGGSNPSYQWKVNGLNAGTGLAVFTYIPQNGDLVSCEMISDADCITGNPAVSNQVEITTISDRPLNLHILLESLYNGGGTMRQAQGESGPQFHDGIADKITVELRNPANGALVFTLSDVSLTTSGSLTAIIPAVHSGSYYIYVKHRNSITTSSAGPVLFSGGTVAYDFSTSASQAYGGNLLNLEGFFVLYGGDVNQDGSVDTGDMTPADNDATTFATGYLPTDVNGDGTVDTADLTIIDNNALLFVNSNLPF